MIEITPADEEAAITWGIRGFQDKSEVFVNFSDFLTEISEDFLMLSRSHNAIYKNVI